MRIDSPHTSAARRVLALASPFAVLAACGSSIAPDLVIGVSDTRRVERGRATNDARVEVGLRFVASPRTPVPADAPTEPTAPRVPGPTTCRSIACAWERAAVARAWVAVVIFLSGAEPADAQPRPTVAETLPTAPAPEGEALARAIEARFVNEPDVVAVVRAALDAAGLDPARARSRVRRGRRSAYLPDVRLSAARQSGVAATAGQTSSDTTSRVGTDDSVRLEASLTFSLSRLLYGQDEVAWSREERAIIDAAASLAREVVELFFRRRRLIVEIEILHEDDADHRVALAEVTALLEVFTAGSFSRMMASGIGPP